MRTASPNQWQAYLQTVSTGTFTKLARLDFLQPDGSIAFSVDNNPKNQHAGAFIQDGELSVNLQNGSRRQVTVMLSNIDGAFDYNVNHLWFGSQIRLMEGLVLPDGSDFYLPQGVFYLRDPEDVVSPSRRVIQYTLTDKWAYLDGTLFGNLEGWALIERGENILDGITGLLQKDRGNGIPIDNVPPIYTTYYNNKTVTLADGTTAPWLNAPYTARFDNNGVTLADIALELNKMLVGWIGYDQNGQLRVDAAYEDILDADKPILWQFTPRNSNFLGTTYSVKNTEMYNDIIVIGQAITGTHIPAGRAVNQDPSSDTNINLLGLRTQIKEESYYYADEQCQELAEYYLKRATVLKKSVSIQSTQLFHITENNLVTVERTDKPGNPVERHLITGFSRPIAQGGQMELTCTSVNDFPMASKYPLPANTTVYAIIEVTVESGAVVGVEKGETTLTGISTGTIAFSVDSYGEWLVAAKLSGRGAKTTVTVSAPQTYKVSLTLTV